MAPLDDPVAHELVTFLQHKGPPWVDDIRLRICGSLAGAEDHYFLAMAQDRLVGHVWYCVSQKDPRLGLIGHVYTVPDMRRQGISRQLLTAAIAEFRDRGGSMMQLFTSTPFSIPLYEQLGFENLFTQTVYHDQDWYMRCPAGSDEQLQIWLEAEHVSLRQLSPGDLPQYCLLYNAQHDVMLKDRAQQIGFGLEAELAFIDVLQSIQQNRAECSVLDNGQTIVGAASLSATVFPHQSHVGLFDIYTCSQARLHARLLADHCLQMRQELGIQQIYAMCIDPSKRELLLQLGFSSRTVLPDHYRIGQQFHDCELLALNDG